MGALSLLRLARRIPGLAKQSELPNLETLIELESLKPKDDYHIARWLLPLIHTTIGLAVFTPLTLMVSPWFLIGAIGLPTIGLTLGAIFHFMAKRITPAQINLRKRSNKLMHRFVGLKNLLGFEGVLSPKVAQILEEASRLYLKCTGVVEDKRPQASVWTDAREKAERAMEEAMGRMLELAEPETAAAQEAELSRGWAMPLLREMTALDQALEEHRHNERLAMLTDPAADALAGLRDARSELERLDSATDELELEQGQNR